ncbi:MAG: FG-GAP repeat protein, partial [Planctomycetes bacterium]|nr:FG-GAP repeat protein [Planctomycetota bacterium]
MLPAAAQSGPVKLCPADGAGYDEFGRTVSISGDYLLSGTHFDDDAGSNSGSAYVFHREGLDWLQQAKLVASDAAAGDRFGEVVAISADRAVVSAPFDYLGAINCGSAYVFRRDGAAWTQESKLVPSDGGANDEFGVSVSIDGGYALVGAHRHSDLYTESGAAYVYRLDGSAWVQEAKLTSSNPAAYDGFGISVSISRSFAIVGAYLQDLAGTNTGAVYVFHRDAGAWSQQAELTASDAANTDFFGWSVSLEGNDALVGAPYQDAAAPDGGAVYV